MAHTKVLSVTRQPAPEEVFDITVEHNHNYYASDSGAKALVHNCIGYALFGPITAKAERESLRPVLEFTNLGLAPPRQYSMWHSGMAWITREKKRNGAIIKQAVKYIEAGRHVVIPVYQLKHVQALVDGINKAMGKNVAVGFTGKSDRETILEQARSGKKIKCVVGIKSIIQAGINVPKWDCLSGDTSIPSSQGLLPIDTLVKTAPASLRVHNGKTWAGIKKKGETGVKRLYKVTLTNGVELKGSKNQKVLAVDLDGSTKMIALCALTNKHYVPLTPAGNKASKKVTLEDTSKTFYERLCAERGTSLADVLNPEIRLKPLICPECGKKFTNLGGHFKAIHPTKKKPDKVRRRELDAYLAIQEVKRTSENKRLKFPKVLDEDLAYLLGMLLTDGCTHRVEWYNNDSSIVKRVEKLYSKQFGYRPNTHARKGAAQEVHASSVLVRDFFNQFFGNPLYSATKFVPEHILRSPKAVVLAFLAGVVDGDSCVSKQSQDGNPQLMCSSKSHSLMRSVHELVFHNLGALGTLRRNATLGMSFCSWSPEETNAILKAVRKYSVKARKMKLSHFKSRNFSHMSHMARQIPESVKRAVQEYTASSGNYTYEGAIVAGRWADKSSALKGCRLSRLASTKNEWRARELDQKLAYLMLPQLKQTFDSLSQEGLYHVRVKSVKRLKAEMTYDFAMSDETRPHFIAGSGFTVHNCMLCIVPMSNAPNQYQEIKRVCTVMDGKPQPIVHHFVTGWSAETGCLRASMPVYREFCDIPDSVKKALSTALAGGRRRDPEEEADAVHKPHRIMF